MRRPKVKKKKPYVVKIIRDEDGSKILYAKWCYVHVICGGNASFCTGQYFGIGESRCEYISKQGKITCPDCIEKIKEIKSIAL